MPRPPTLDRWTADELRLLQKMALKDPGKDAMEVAQLFVKRHPKRTLDAAKQRVFKMRRDQATLTRRAAPAEKSEPVPHANERLVRAIDRLARAVERLNIKR